MSKNLSPLAKPLDGYKWEYDVYEMKLFMTELYHPQGKLLLQ